MWIHDDEAGKQLMAPTLHGLMPILATPFDESGALVGGIDALRDVQAEHDAREALAVSEEHYRLLAENSSDIVFRSTRDSRIEWISPSVAAVLGFDAGGLVGTTTSDLVHPDDRPHVLSVIRASGGPGVRSYEARFLTAAGELVEKAPEAGEFRYRWSWLGEGRVVRCILAEQALTAAA